MEKDNGRCYECEKGTDFCQSVIGSLQIGINKNYEKNKVKDCAEV